MWQGAYLCRHRILEIDILGSGGTEDIEESVQPIDQPIRSQLEITGGTEYRTEREEARYQVPYHPLDDYSGDDYVAVENNMDDDMMKVIEGGLVESRKLWLCFPSVFSGSDHWRKSQVRAIPVV